MFEGGAANTMQCKVCVVLAVLPENMIVIMYLQRFGLTSLAHSLLVNRFILYRLHSWYISPLYV